MASNYGVNFDDLYGLNPTPTYADVLGNITGTAQSLSSGASRVLDLVQGFGGMEAISTSEKVRDVNTNGFLVQNSLFVPDYFARAFDEPTYLTFKIEFGFDNPRNVLYNNDVLKNTATVGNIYHGETAFDYMPEPFLQDSILAQVDNQKTGDELTYTPKVNGSIVDSGGASYFYSAEDYLGYCLGEYGRARLIRKIKQILRDLQDNFPYYFRSVDGLSALNKIDPKTGKRVKDGVITIKCYEGVDLKITQLIQMIRKVMWDDVYQRWVLPDMMRYFSMRIYVSEIRTFHEPHSFFNLNNFGSNPGSVFSGDPQLNLYNFGDPDVRNSTNLPNQTIFDKVMGITGGVLTAAQAMGQQFLPPAANNVIGGINNTVSTVTSVGGALSNAFQMMCISAINHVMPTICFELHMCEFDISDTVSQINTLNSTAGNPQEQEIKIKVHQIEDYQVYPLDRNLKVTTDSKGYYLDTTIYGMSDDRSAHDDANLANDENDYGRPKGFSGSTVFADAIFDKTFNNELRRSFDMSRDAGKNVNQDKLYRHMSTMYDDALKSYFSEHVITINDENYGINSPRSKMYSKVAKEAIYGKDSDAVGTSLRYKMNTLPPATGILSLLYSGMNILSDFGVTGKVFSKATKYTTSENYGDFVNLKDLQDELPNVVSAAKALRTVFTEMKNSNYDDEFLEKAGRDYLRTLAYSKATQYTALGVLSKDIIEQEYITR